MHCRFALGLNRFTSFGFVCTPIGIFSRRDQRSDAFVGYPRSLRPDPIVGFRVHCGCGFTCSGRKFSKATRTLKIRRTCSGTFASGRVPEHFYKIAISVFTEGVALLWFYPKDENSRFESAAGRTLISDEPGEWQHGPSYRSGRAARC